MKPEAFIILTPGFPGSETEDNCLPSQQIFVKYLKEYNPSLKIFVLAFEYPFVRAEYSWYGIRVISFNGKNKRKLRRIGAWLNVWRALKKIKRENNITGLFSFWCGECALLGKYFGKVHHLKHFCWVLGQDARKGNKLVKFIKPKPGELIAMSDFLADQFYKNYKVKPQIIIPNAIDKKMFSISNTGRDIDILGVGSLIPLKRYDIFVSVVNEVCKPLPGIKVVHYGEGNENDKMLALIRSLHLEDIISLHGKKSHKEVLQIMQRSKILLHPSSYEGFSGVCLEALYAGAHVISFCKPMNEDIKHWHIVSSEEEMITKVFEILNDKNTAYTSVLYSSIDDTAKQVMDLFLH